MVRKDRMKLFEESKLRSIFAFAGFDDLGRQFDLNGNLKDWWMPETKSKFLRRANCIIEQYGNFTEPNVKMKVTFSYLKQLIIFLMVSFTCR